MMNDRIVLSESPEQTEALGRRIGRAVRNGCVLALHGDLGAGKTVLARGVARGLGIVEPVTSPTFTVVQEYARPEGGWLFHLDMYRIDDSEAALAFGVEEFLFAEDGIALVEWPERILDLLETPVPDALAHIRLRHLSESTRQIVIPCWLAESLELQASAEEEMR